MLYHSSCWTVLFLVIGCILTKVRHIDLVGDVGATEVMRLAVAWARCADRDGGGLGDYNS
jgi:hypothetical protein